MTLQGVAAHRLLRQACVLDGGPVEVAVEHTHAQQRAEVAVDGVLQAVRLLRRGALDVERRRGLAQVYADVVRERAGAAQLGREHVAPGHQPPQLACRFHWEAQCGTSSSP